MILPVWAVASALGIVGALLLPPTMGIGAAVGVGIGGLWQLAHRRWATAGTALTLSAGLGMGLYTAVFEQSPAFLDSAEVTAIATVIRGPEAAGEEPARVRLRLKLETIDGRDVGGVVSLSVRGGVPDVAPGDRVSVRTRLHTPRGLANPGLPDARLMAKAQRIDFYASLQSPERVQKIATGPAWGPRRIAHRLRVAMGRAIEEVLARDPARLLRTVVLGERSGVDVATEDGFRAAGATHVLSVSGLHLTAVAALLFFLLRRLASTVPAVALRVPSSTVAALLSMPAIIGYTLLTGEAIATERSALMAVVALGAVATARPFAIGASIAAAAVVLFGRTPLVLLDPSFQLSFASVMALGLFAGPLATGHGGRAGVARVGRWLIRFGAATIAASLVTAPLVAHHFGELAWASPLGNLVLVPLVEMLVLPFGLVGALLAMLHPVLGILPLTIAEYGARAALMAAEWFARLTPVLLVRSPTPSETAAMIVAAGCLLAAWAYRGRRWLLYAGVSGAIAVTSIGAREIARRTSDAMAVTFLDVGQGDALVIEGPRGFAALVDGGGSIDGTFDPGARVIEPYLRRRGISRLDLVALSHPHPDHMNGLFRVLERFEVVNLWTSGDDGKNPRYRALIALATRRGAAMPNPVNRVVGGGMWVEPVGPWLGDRVAAPPGVSVNDASLVLRLVYAGRSVLLTGDLEAQGETELVARGALGMDLTSDVLKVPHHGSRTSSTPELLDAAKPGIAVISLGHNNRFGFPRREVLSRLTERQVRVLRTDLHGAVTVALTAQGELHTTCVRGCR